METEFLSLSSSSFDGGNPFGLCCRIFYPVVSAAAERLCGLQVLVEWLANFVRFLEVPGSILGTQAAVFPDFTQSL
jgi:hypothetical protein